MCTAHSIESHYHLLLLINESRINVYLVCWNCAYFSQDLSFYSHELRWFSHSIVGRLEWFPWVGVAVIFPWKSVEFSLSTNSYLLSTDNGSSIKIQDYVSKAQKGSRLAKDSKFHWKKKEKTVFLCCENHFSEKLLIHLQKISHSNIFHWNPFEQISNSFQSLSLFMEFSVNSDGLFLLLFCSWKTKNEVNFMWFTMFISILKNICTCTLS